MTRRTSLVALVALALSCKPSLNETVSLITEPTIIAVTSTPVEAPPMTKVTYQALVVDGSGVVRGPSIHWSYCTARNPLSNLGPVSTACTEIGGPDQSPIGQGLQATAVIPSDACTTFGPNAPPATATMPAGRPVDPDPTGGYYQPVDAVLTAGGSSAITLYPLRLSCGFSGASETSQAELAARYHFNENPSVVSLAVVGGATLPMDGTGKPFAVGAGQKLALRVTWPTCPTSDTCGDGVCGADETIKTCPKDCTTPKGCGGAERYVNFDLASQSVNVRREGMVVSWYATGGTFDSDATGRSGDDTTPSSDNGWVTPSQSGPAHVWVVLHDERGGVGFVGTTLDVQ